MKRVFLTSLVAGLLMVSSAGLSFVAKPTKRIADSGPKIELESFIPKQFGDWRLDDTVVPIQPSPDTKAVLEKIYSQTLSRTYINAKGDRVMLSIAYGGDQSDSMQVHKPEICYPAQGFSILANLKAYLSTQFGELPVKRLVAKQGARVEPITYWITVGDQMARSGWEQKLAQLRYGLTGKIPDGMLFRVSTIDRDEVHAYKVQGDFIQSVLQNMKGPDRARLIGVMGA